MIVQLHGHSIDNFLKKNNETSGRVQFPLYDDKNKRIHFSKPSLRIPSLLANCNPDTDRLGKLTLECDPHVEKPVGVINMINSRKKDGH